MGPARTEVSTFFSSTEQGSLNAAPFIVPDSPASFVDELNRPRQAGEARAARLGPPGAQTLCASGFREA